MDNPVVLIENFPHTRTAQCPEIEGLPAGSWIKRRAIQSHAKPAGVGLDHARAEFAHVAIGVVKTIRVHWLTLLRRRRDIEFRPEKLPVRHLINAQFCGRGRRYIVVLLGAQRRDLRVEFGNRLIAFLRGSRHQAHVDLKLLQIRFGVIDGVEDDLQFIRARFGQPETGELDEFGHRVLAGSGGVRAARFRFCDRFFRWRRAARRKENERHDQE